MDSSNPFLKLYQKADPTYPLFPIFAFLGFAVGIVPLPWHLQAWNAGTCIYMLWASIASLIQFVDSIVWYNSLHDVAPVWCDISTKFIIGAGVGIPASALCIARRLHTITTMRTVGVTRKEKRNAVLIDIAIAVGLPIIVMALHYVVQGHRYNIVENIGCIPVIWNTVPAYPLVFMWPPLLGAIAFVYCALTLRTFYKHRVQLAAVMSKSQSLTISRCLRLIMLCCVEMALVMPLGAFSIYINTAGLHIEPWVSWANTHYNFSFVELIPTLAWQAKIQSHVAVEMGRWIYPCSSLLFFSLFGFAEEARRNYKAAFWWSMKWFGVRPSPKNTSAPIKVKGSFTKFPSFARKALSSEPDDLPPYSPPPRAKTKKDNMRDTNPFSHGDAIDVPVDIDLEKCLASPTSSASDMTASMPYDPEQDATVIHVIHISDAYPASMPPTPEWHGRPPSLAHQPPTIERTSPVPRIVAPPAAMVPEYHRPFSPRYAPPSPEYLKPFSGPGICPVGAPVEWPEMDRDRSGSFGSISVTIETEVSVCEAAPEPTTKTAPAKP